MKRKLGILVIVAVIALLPLTSCMSAPKAAAPTVPVATEYDKSQDSKIAENKAQIEKEHQSISELQSNKLSKSEYTASTSYPKTETYTRSEVYTKAEVDALIAKLKTELQASGSTGSTSGTTATVTNQVTVKTYNMSPSTIYGSGNYTIFVEVKNGYAEAKKIILMATLTPDNANIRVNSIGTKFSSDSPYITGSGDKMATSVSAGDCGCSSWTNLIMGTTNQIFIGGNTTILIPIELALLYCGAGDGGCASSSSGAIWSPTWSVTVF